MHLTKHETRALAFVLLVVVLAAVARLRTEGEPVLAGTAGLDLAALEAAAARERAEEARRSLPLAPGERIDVNRAPASELDRLPGIGPTVAERITAERDSGGAFHSAADLEARVSGIGPATRDRIGPHLTFSGGGSSSSAASFTSGSPALHPGSVLLDRGTAGPAAPAGPAGSSGDASASGNTSGTPFVVDLNRATAAQLERLPGIGPVLAGRIVAYRDSIGGFRNVSALEAVSGIGPKTLANLKPHLRVRR